jgi:hypothetical protein
VDSAWIGLGGVVIGLVSGHLSTYLSGRRDAATQAKVRAHEHATWLRERRADTYVDLLELAEQMGLWLGRVHPMYTIGDGPPVPPIPTDEHQIKILARVNAYASGDVKERYLAWREAVWPAIHAAEDISRGDNGRRSDLHDLRTKEMAARAELGEAIAREFGPDGMPATEHP